MTKMKRSEAKSLILIQNWLGQHQQLATIISNMQADANMLPCALLSSEIAILENKQQRKLQQAVYLFTLLPTTTIW